MTSTKNVVRLYKNGLISLGVAVATLMYVVSIDNLDREIESLPLELSWGLRLRVLAVDFEKPDALLFDVHFGYLPIERFESIRRWFCLHPDERFESIREWFRFFPLV